MKGTALARGLLLASGMALFVVFKLYGLRFAAGDENIYFYLAEQMADGALPYRDFFHAHPPLHLSPLAFLYWINDGFSLLPARLLTGLSTLGAAFWIARIDRTPFSWAAVLGSLVFLSSFDVLRISTHFGGTNLAAFWLAFALERLCRGRDAQAALAFCLGGFTMLNVAPAAVGATLLLVFVDRKRGLRLAGYGVLGIAGLNLLAIAAFGPAYLEQVYLFHLAKPAANSQTAGVFLAIVQMNGWWIAGSVMGAIAWLLGVLPQAEERPNAPPARLDALRAEFAAHLPLALSAGAALGSLLFLLWANQIFVYYFQLLFVCLAPLAGAGFAALGEALRRSFDGTIDDAKRLGEIRFAACILTFLGVIAQLPGWTMKNPEVAHAIRHVWQSSPSASIDKLVRPVFWSDVQEPDVLASAFTHLLWHEADSFESATSLAREVRARCAPDTTVFGDSTAAPLVALLADRKLALGEADTNNLRFRSGQTSAEAFIGALEARPPCGVVRRANHGVLRLPEFASWLEHHYEAAFEAKDPLQTRRYTLLIRK